MFNVCPGCGEYTEAKEIISPPPTAVCPNCGYEWVYLSLSLFVVTGASGSGKTTAALELVKMACDLVVLDQDILWNDAFNAPEYDYQLFRNTWLRMVKNIHQAGKSVVLFGSAIPEQYECCVERRYLSTIHYLALCCEPRELERRLIERPNWRKSGSSENLRRMVDFNKWLSNNAAKTKPPMTLLNTTELTVRETVKSIHEWIDERIQGPKSLDKD